MHRHPYFDLCLHDTDELGELIGCPIAARLTLHEWPLSCVQRIKCENGQAFIYKVQAPPTVEPDFYRCAHSALIVGAQVLPIEGMPPALLLEDINAPRLDSLDFPTTTALGITEAVVSQIACIKGDLPAIHDIRTEEKWLTYAQSIIGDVRTLVDTGIFQHVNAAQIDQIARHIDSSAVISAIAGPTGYVHSDLRAENVLVLDGGYKVLDWQRPIWGPVALDRVTLLESLGITPDQYVQLGALQLRKLMLIGWFAQAGRFWFPAGAATYDTEIARLVKGLGTR